MSWVESDWEVAGIGNCHPLLCVFAALAGWRFLVGLCLALQIFRPPSCRCRWRYFMGGFRKMQQVGVGKLQGVVFLIVEHKQKHNVLREAPVGQGIRNAFSELRTTNLCKPRIDLLRWAGRRRQELFREAAHQVSASRSQTRHVLSCYEHASRLDFPPADFLHRPGIDLDQNTNAFPREDLGLHSCDSVLRRR